MIGVLPPLSAAWQRAAEGRPQLEYRILGKGGKIRRVNVAPALLRSVWSNANARFDRHPQIEMSSAAAFRNQYGKPLSYHAIWTAIDAANEKVGGTIRISPHDLRRAFACHFLEQGIQTRARERGYDPSDIPITVMLSIGHDLLMTIKEELGHSEYKTTKIYLDQVINGKIRPAALKEWNDYLDATFHAA